MASVGQESSFKSKWGRRSLDAPVNLIPYIDLMTTIITFLMMTAVWAQIQALEIQNGAGAEQVKEDPLRSKLISVVITGEGFLVHEEGLNLKTLHDLSSLGQVLTGLKQADPKRYELEIHSADGISYDQIVKVIDIATGAGLTGIALKPLEAS